MSFLDDLSDFFVTGDTFYPDNKNRAARVVELQEDCESFLAKCRMYAETQTRLMEQVNGKLSAIADKAPSIPKELELVQLQDDHMPWEQMASVFFAVQGIPAMKALWTLASGIIHHKKAEDIMVDLGIGLGIDLAMYAGTIVFIGLPVAILIPGAVNGAVRRDRLREGIKKGYKNRQEICTLMHTGQQFCEKLDAVQKALDAFLELALPLDELKRNIAGEMEALKKESQNTAQQVQEYLKGTDAKRGSWTNEDH